MFYNSIFKFFRKIKFLIFILFFFINHVSHAQRSIAKTSNTGYLNILSVNSSDTVFIIKMRNLKQKNSLSFPDDTKIILKFDGKKYYNNIKSVKLKNGEFFSIK